MDLITDAKDERLVRVETADKLRIGMVAIKPLLIKSLRAALTRAEAAEADVASLRARVNLTEMVLKEFEKKLGNLGEAAKKVLASCPNHRSPPYVHPFWNAMDELEGALDALKEGK